MLSIPSHPLYSWYLFYINCMCLRFASTFCLFSTNLQNTFLGLEEKLKKSIYSSRGLNPWRVSESKEQLLGQTLISQQHSMVEDTVQRKKQEMRKFTNDECYSTRSCQICISIWPESALRKPSVGCDRGFVWAVHHNTTHTVWGSIFIWLVPRVASVHCLQNPWKWERWMAKGDKWEKETSVDSGLHPFSSQQFNEQGQKKKKRRKKTEHEGTWTFIHCQ